MAPFHTSRQEPSERQDDPPNRRRHTEEIQHHEQNRTPFFLRTLNDGFIAVGKKALVAHGFVPEKVTSDIRNGKSNAVADFPDYDEMMRFAVPAVLLLLIFGIFSVLSRTM